MFRFCVKVSFETALVLPTDFSIHSQKRLQSRSLRMPSRGYTIRSACGLSLIAYIFSYCRILEGLSLCVYSLRTNYNPKQNLKDFICFLQPNILVIVSASNFSPKFSFHNFSKGSQFPIIFLKQLAQTVYLVTQSLSKLVASCSSRFNVPSSFSVSLPNIFSRFEEY